ncbi:hypothetical protein CEUSTIGMA_g11589.t1 [Chlamydomonas eustigma]|uniref:Protein kinase domain-containing protein n=1 Tax=Chlamydomonas eustigma TaxID=1157962 RepID=A0A250XMC4_9CHLO|nr:hypothetical protein CEUSTIGMA_g11589.t1 [Chlamydomonas eustigma]|eukprot:GAX84166.1 hypothetical protein CEUSTIGMA_g11589.t1 [Chlamydomonas eustigma]
MNDQSPSTTAKISSVQETLTQASCDFTECRIEASISTLGEGLEVSGPTRENASIGAWQGEVQASKSEQHLIPDDMTEVQNVRRQQQPTEAGPSAPRKPRALREGSRGVITTTDTEGPEDMDQASSSMFGNLGPLLPRSKSFFDVFKARKSVEMENNTGSPASSLQKKSVRGSSLVTFFTSDADEVDRGRQVGNTSDAGGDKLKPQRRSSILGRLASGAQHTVEGIGSKSMSDLKSLGKSLRSMSFAMFGKLASGGMSLRVDAGRNSADPVQEAPEWLTSLEEFKPVTLQLHSNKIRQTFFARSIHSGKHYVLKKYEKGEMNSAELTSVQSMVGKAHFLNHENLIQLHGNWEDSAAIYIVEEYAYGGDLLQDRLTHPERYSEAFVAKTVVLPLLRVLRHMHENRIVHRTLCPEHLMLGRKRVLKVGHLLHVAHMGVEDLVDRTGLLDYMPPEMLALQEPSGSRSSSASQAALLKEVANAIKGNNKWELQQDYDEKVDVWQVGCVVHELLCGTPPFSTDDKQLSAALILWADIHEWPDSISPECISFIQDCLIKDPENRPSCEDLLDHSWISKSARGEVLLSVRQLREAQDAASLSHTKEETDSGWRGWLSSAWGGLSSIFTEPPLETNQRDNALKI